MIDLKQRLDDLDAYLIEYGLADAAPPIELETARVKAVIDGYLDRTNALLLLFSTLSAYVSGHVTTDSYDTVAKRLQSELDMLGVRVRQQSVRFQAWLGRSADALPAVLELDGPARAHAFYLRETGGAKPLPDERRRRVAGG